MSVTIKPYSAALRLQFKVERERLAKLLGDDTPIEHVGSSAVSIGGKNIIDILIGVENREEMDKIRDILSKNGYFEGDDTHEDRIFMANKTSETKEGDYHVHICPMSEDSYKDFILLRDFLISNPDKAQEYQDRKNEFAKNAGFDRKKYKILKSEYLSKILTEVKSQKFLHL